MITALSSRTFNQDASNANQDAALRVPDPQSERDALIAASALVHGMAVVTRDTQDFAATGVPTLSLWQARTVR